MRSDHMPVRLQLCGLRVVEMSVEALARFEMVVESSACRFGYVWERSGGCFVRLCVPVRVWRGALSCFSDAAKPTLTDALLTFRRSTTCVWRGISCVSERGR